MPQSIFIQVGQCGNQVGFSFWKYAAQEYIHSDCISNVEIDYFFEPTCDWTTDKSFQDCYKARGVLVDMEENVISQGIRGVTGNLFRQDQILTDNSGSGNNWAVGNINYGLKHRNIIQDMIRREAERCDHLETFLLTFSLGGGTGSGLGTSILDYLQNEYGRNHRIVFAAFPSVIDDVVTSPYNAILANNELIEKASLVIPFENQILNKICQRNLNRNSRVFSSKSAVPKANTSSGSAMPQDNPFDDMNRIIAYAILDLTSSCRFSGNMNLDMADIVTNLVPHPNIHYAIPSVTPLSPDEDSSSDKLFKDILSGSNQLTSCAIKRGKIYSSILQARGPISQHEMVTKLNESLGIDLRFFKLHDDIVKIGICDVPRLYFSRSLLQLANCTSIASTFGAMKNNFCRMYEKKAHLHHFLEVDSDIDSKLGNAVDKLNCVMSEYVNLENEQPDQEDPRPSVL